MRREKSHYSVSGVGTSVLRFLLRVIQNVILYTTFIGSILCLILFFYFLWKSEIDQAFVCAVGHLAMSYTNSKY